MKRQAIEWTRRNHLLYYRQEREGKVWCFKPCTKTFLLGNLPNQFWTNPGHHYYLMHTLLASYSKTVERGKIKADIDWMKERDNFVCRSPNINSRH
jgi:hypothetical protein